MLALVAETLPLEAAALDGLATSVHAYRDDRRPGVHVAVEQEDDRLPGMHVTEEGEEEEAL